MGSLWLRPPKSVTHSPLNSFRGIKVLGVALLLRVRMRVIYASVCTNSTYIYVLYRVMPAMALRLLYGGHTKWSTGSRAKGKAEAEAKAAICQH